MSPSSSTRDHHRQDEAARLLIIDDHALVRDGLKVMLSIEPDLEIVGEAANGKEALELCHSLRPNLALMDLRMAGMDGLSATRTIKLRYPEVSVLVLTAHENEEYMLEAIRAGASGYVLKDAPRQQLSDSIRRVLEGESVLTQGLAARLIRQLADEIGQSREHSPEREERRRILDLLTPREIEVLRLLAQGYSNSEIAKSLYVTAGTAKNHVEHIFAKLEVSDRTQAVVRAIKLQIVDISEL